MLIRKDLKKDYCLPIDQIKIYFKLKKLKKKMQLIDHRNSLPQMIARYIQLVHISSRKFTIFSYHLKKLDKLNYRFNPLSSISDPALLDIFVAKYKKMK